MKNIFLSSILWMFFLSSCLVSMHLTPMDHFDKTPHLMLKCSRDVNLEDYDILKPFSVLKCNQSIIFQDFSDKKSLIKIATNDFKTISGGVSEGDGPLDVLGAFSIMEIDGSVLINDWNHRKFLSLSLDSLNVLNVVENKLDIDLSLNSVPVSGGRFIVVGGYNDSVFFRYIDVDSGTTLSEEPYPYDEVLSDYGSFSQTSVYYNTKFTVSPDKRKYAWGVNYTQKMGFGSISDDRLISDVVLSYSPLNIGTITSDGVIIPSDDSKRNIITCASTNKYVFFLYWGSDYGDMRNVYSKDILVYTWDGIPYKHLKVAENLYDIKYDVKTNSLYGISYEPDAHYVEYSLNGIL